MSFRTPKLIDLAGEEPITVDQARAHLEAQRYDDSDIDPIDDAMIEAWLSAAREHCENFTGLSLMPKVLEIALDTFPSARTDGTTAIDLPGGPVRSIESITVPVADDAFTSDDVDSDDLVDEDVWADGTVNPDLYVLDDYRRPNQVKPVTAWPTVTSATNGVKVRYLAGYGLDSDAGVTLELPKGIRAAILLVLGHLFANREATTDQALQHVPLGVESLLRPHRVLLGMA